MGWKKGLGLGLAVVVGIFIVLQILSIPVLMQQTNPPVVQEPAWDSPETRVLAQRACFDCHSNEVNWPLYSKIAPISWSVTNHVVEGRQALNFSDWNNYGEDAGEIAEVIRSGEMPLSDYLMMHPEADLTPAEKEQLIAGMQATPPGSNSGGGEDREYDEDDDDD
ncbi:MAG: heme-binding domain-containing protein [Chloroflexaceae bacterium]|nr:heme-binding domain-containing protein [Chloroflexaceae bacterium]